MSRTLYVGNLPLSATVDVLTVKFTACGTVVSVKFPSAVTTRRSNGVAFVEMANNNQAQAAIDRFNMSDFDGRVISVNKMHAAGAAALAPTAQS